MQFLVFQRRSVQLLSSPSLVGDCSLRMTALGLEVKILFMELFRA